MSYRGWENITEADLRKKSQPAKSKYRAVPTEAEGIRFASKREAERFLVLRNQQLEGLIINLELQPQYALTVINPAGLKIVIGRYIADFRYVMAGKTIVEDAKGMKTALYLWKKNHVESEYAIKILET